jgi:K+-transporting ATPase ATPase A chain
MVKGKKQGFAIFGAMFIMFAAGLFIQYNFEKANTIGNLSVFMEGKESRFGLVNSVLWAEATTSASNGSVNAMHDSFSPIAGLVNMMNLMTGEVIFGGAGAGLYGMLMYVILTVFIAGLMVGRTPEYLGKKIEKKEMIMSAIAVLAPSFVILLFASAAILIPSGLLTLGNQGPHGLSEIIYNFSSAAGNNGSAFAGMGTDNVFYNVMIGLGMLIGRFAVIIPVLIIADSMGKKEKVCISIGTFRTDTILFTILLVSIIFFVGLLTFFPVLMLGPVAEHLLHLNGITF